MMRAFDAQRIFSARFGLVLAAGFAALIFTPAAFTPALALSELREIPGTQGAEDVASEEEDGDLVDEPLQLPMPDPLVNRPVAEEDGSVEVTEPEAAPENAVPVEVLSDMSRVPEPVRRMRQMIVEAAASGDMERLAPLLGRGMTQTQVSQVETDEDAVTTLKSLSGDPDGIEILAILLDVLSTGFVHVGQGTPEEIYVWPYFTEKSLAGLTPPEKVDLLRLVTAGDFADMQEFGSYNFYKVGITPDGQWKFFVAGD